MTEAYLGCLLHSEAVAERARSGRIFIVDARAPNLSDPDYEPSDEELVGLSKRAFAGLKDAEDARLQQLRSDLVRAREEALARFARGSTR